MRERRIGCRLESAPITGPTTMPKTTYDAEDERGHGGREPLADGEEREAPQQHERRARERRREVRPERQPGRRDAPTTRGSPRAGRPTTSRRGSRPSRCRPTTSASRSGGWLRMTANVSTVKSTPSPARLPNATLQHVACSSAAIGRIASSCPDWPTMPVSCTRNGACRSGNHTATTRSTLGKTAASPAPRACARRSPMPTSGANAMHELPDRHEEHAGRDDRPRPEAVEQQPHRDLHRAVDGELDDREQRQRRGIRVEPHRRVDADRRERRAVRDREHVGGDADAPHQPQAPGAHGQGVAVVTRPSRGERVTAASGASRRAFQPNRAGSTRRRSGPNANERMPRVGHPLVQRSRARRAGTSR